MRRQAFDYLYYTFFMRRPAELNLEFYRLERECRGRAPLPRAAERESWYSMNTEAWD